jgi:hypothetical protein
MDIGAGEGERGRVTWHMKVTCMHGYWCGGGGEGASDVAHESDIYGRDRQYRQTRNTLSHVAHLSHVWWRQLCRSSR